MVGVEPEVQGRGYASAMIKPVLQRCDQGRAYLECTTASNVALYDHMGFEVVGELDLGKGAPTFWTMWREPR